MKDPQMQSGKWQRTLDVINLIGKCNRGEFSSREALVEWAELLRTHAPDEIAQGLAYGTTPGIRTNQKG